MENELLPWIELILAAVLERRDAQPLVALAVRAGVDLDALQYFANVTLDSVADHLMNAAGMVGWIAGPGTAPHEELFTSDDLAALEKLGITVN